MAYIYLINELGSDNYKIGLTKGTIDKRKSQLQTGNSQELLVVRKYKTNHPSKLEKLLHVFYANKRTIGEWFELSDDDVMQFTEKCDKASETIDLLMETNYFFQNNII